MRILVLVVFLSLVYGVQRFWFLRAWRAAEQLSSPVLRHGVEVFLIAAVLAFVLSLFNPVFSRFIPGHLVPQGVVTVSRLWLIASFFAFIAVQSVGALEWVSNFATRFRSTSDSLAFNPARREFFRYAAYFAGSVPFLATTYGFAAGRLRYRVEKIDVPIPNLPPGLDGLRIAQLSDIHIGSYMPPHEIARAVDMANHLNPHLAVITGDFVSDRTDPLGVCIGELSKLKAPLGVFGCNGNHEIYAGAEDAAQALFHTYGMRLLRQESVEIAHGGDKFNLIGVDYQRDHMVSGAAPGPMLNDVAHLVRRDVPNVLLSHNPNSFHRAAELGIELSLAGHTHGGQVQFEIVDRRITPARLITDFVAGLYQLPMPNGNHDALPESIHDGNSAIHNGAGATHGASANHDGNGATPKHASLYVNRGLGTFGMPVRLGVPPEITLLILRRA